MATLADLQAELAAYKAARGAILQAQSYSMAGRTMTYADLGFVQKHIDELETRIACKASGPRTSPVFINSRG